MSAENKTIREDALKEVVLILENMAISTNDLTEESTKEQLGIDSLDVLELADAIEKKTGRALKDQEIENWTSISDIVNSYLKKS